MAISRWVHPKILTRISGLLASGFNNWWDDIILNLLSRLRVKGIENRVEERDEKGKPKASNLSVRKYCGSICNFAHWLADGYSCLFIRKI